MRKMHTLAERTNVTLDGKRLQGKEAQGKLLGCAGAQIPMEDAIALGLVETAPQKKESAPAEDKAMAPVENKSVERKKKK